MTFEQFNDLKRLVALYRAHRTSASFIARSLGMSLRHIRRLIAHLKPPVARSAWNRTDDDIRAYLVEAKKEQPKYNCQWLAELASDRFRRPISQSTVYRILKGANVLRRETDTPTLRRRFESAACGDLVQMDTSWGYWLGDRKLYLILLLDDHSRMILHAKFFLEETLWHNMTMVRETIEKHGVFKVLYTDNASWFKAIRHNRSLYQTHAQREYESDIAKACRDLGIVHVTHKPYEPQGKGKIERIFRFIQERFVSELDDPFMSLWLVNKKFKEWVVWYNTRHVNRTTGQKPKERFDPKAFKPLSVTERNKLDDIFCIRETRSVDKCNEFGYQGKRYRIPGHQNFAHQRISLRIQPDKRISIWQSHAYICEFSLN